MITTKSGLSVAAGGLLAAGLTYLWTKRRSSPPLAGLHGSNSHDLYDPTGEEFDSARGDHPLAPDRAAMGEPLRDLDVIELPLGQTADRS